MKSNVSTQCPLQPTTRPRPVHARHRFLTGVGALAVAATVAVTLGACGGGGEATVTSPSEVAASTGSGEEAPATEQVAPTGTFPGMQDGDVVATGGDTVDDGGVQVTATPLTAGDPTYGATACSTVTIVNNGSNSLDVNALDFTLQDPAGAIKDVGFLGTENHLSASTLISGGTMSGDVCFDVDISAGGQYVLLYEPVLALNAHRVAWVNQL